MADPYGSVAAGSLKLKGVSDHKIKKKKKKKDKEMKKNMEETLKNSEQSSVISEENGELIAQNKSYDRRTKAEMAFERVKEKRQEEEILEKASKTHKERIMDFNRHLDNLTEHFDIPKVSWTK